VSVFLIGFSPPGVSHRVREWDTGRQAEDANEEVEVENIAEAAPEPEVDAETALDEEVNPEQKSFGAGAPELNAEEPVYAVDKSEPAIVLGDTVMVDVGAEADGGNVDKTEANGNIQRHFISKLKPSVPIACVSGKPQETNGKMETPEHTQDTPHGNSDLTTSQANDTELTNASAYGTQ
jgi:hypothetical protein